MNRPFWLIQKGVFYFDSLFPIELAMEVPDELIIKYFKLATDEHPDEIDKVNQNLEKGVNQ